MGGPDAILDSGGHAEFVGLLTNVAPRVVPKLGGRGRTAGHYRLA